jgi:23S rRNA pseudouridine1911/1915/1917 synthase
MEQCHHFTVEISDSGQRLDKFLSQKLPDISRARLQRMIQEGCTMLNGSEHTDSASKLKADDRLTLNIPDAKPLALEPVAMPLEIIYEDDDLAVINKPAGLTVHPAPGETDPTLVHALLHHCGASLSGIGGVQRPGIVHRLDKHTSGAMLIAKHDAAHQHLANQLQDRSLSRRYHAVVYGVPQPPRGKIEGNIGRHPHHRKKMAVLAGDKGKAARTFYEVLDTAETALSLIQCKLETGRTHQIRVHCTHQGHPLVGDPIYGRARKLQHPEWQQAIKQFTRQALHAVELSFIHPRTGESYTVHAPYPDDFAQLLNILDLRAEKPHS